MSWKEQIATNTTMWRGIEGYVADRTVDLTAVCTSPESTDGDIRRAQAGILELQRLLALPEIIRAESQIRAQMTARKEY